MKRVKHSIKDLMNEHLHLKINNHEVQSLVHDMTHENMQGQQSMAHQAMYFSLGQDAGIEVTHRADWWDVRNNLLQKLLDESTEGPGDESVSINPASRDPFQSRDQGKRSDFEIFERGDAVSIKETSDCHVRYGWIMGRAPAIEHTGTALNDTEGRRFFVELLDGSSQ